MAELNDQDHAAEMAGRNAGWMHANYVEAYGTGDGAPTECPLYFADSVTFWQAGYDEGKELFENGQFADGTPVDSEAIAAVVRDLGTCGWFLMCEEPAGQFRFHPVLGSVPVCDKHMMEP